MTEATKRPFISVVVPSCNRPGALTVCLEALARQTYPADRFEVIVVDDGSDPPLQPLVTSDRGSACTRWLRQVNSGPAAARNAGATTARGAVVAFTDDDCAPAPGWLDALAARLDGREDTAVGGRTVNSLTDNVYAAAGQLLVDYVYSTLNSAPGRARFFASNNLALPLQRFRVIGGFDTRFSRAAGEDRELCERWRGQGFSLVYAPEAVVSHAHAQTLVSFVRQQINYGRGAALLRQTSRRSGGGRMTLEPLSFYLGLLSYPLRQHGTHARGRIAALFLMAQAAIAVGAAWERAARAVRGDAT